MTITHNQHRPLPVGFTLIELVLVMTIIALVVGASIPSFTGLEDERAARQPVLGLLSLAKETRMHAKRENRPYQIIIDSEGAFAMRYSSPYEEHGMVRQRFKDAMVQADERRELIRQRTEGLPIPAPGEIGLSGSGSVIDAQEWTRETDWLDSYTFPEDIVCSVRSWGESQFMDMRGEEMRRWVFQPSGLCDPMTIRMERDGSYFEVTFDPLTADIAKEESYVE